MRISTLREFNALPAVAVVINCRTHWVSTLALVSTLKSVNFPVILINCGDSQEAYRHFSRVAAAWHLNFYYCELPFRKHGETLDRVFSELKVDYVLLVDSDVEVLDRNVVTKMLDSLQESPALYGSGLLHGPEGMDERHGFLKNSVVYQQRMWIPFVLLRARAIRDAIRNDQSFSQFRIYNEFPSWPALSKLLAVRFWLPVRKLFGSAPGQRPVSATAPVSEYDTGAALHQYLRNIGYQFEVFPELESAVVHLHGATRAKVRPFWKKVLRLLRMSVEDNASTAVDLDEMVIRKIADDYKLPVCWNAHAPK